MVLLPTDTVVELRMAVAAATVEVPVVTRCLT